jgi:hypothetical protein
MSAKELMNQAEGKLEELIVATTEELDALDASGDRESEEWVTLVDIQNWANTAQMKAP